MDSNALDTIPIHRIPILSIGTDTIAMDTHPFIAWLRRCSERAHARGPEVLVGPPGDWPAIMTGCTTRRGQANDGRKGLLAHARSSRDNYASSTLNSYLLRLFVDIRLGQS